MKLTVLSHSPVDLFPHPSSNYQATTSPYPDRPMQMGGLSPTTELLVLPVFALILMLLLQGSRRLCYATFNTLYARYQGYRFSLQQRQVETLERILSLSSATRERG